MTGFGKSAAQSKDYAMDITVRSVNGRFLEIKIFGPKFYNSIETEIRKRISKKIFRGTVEIYINRRSLSTSEKVHFNEGLAQEWMLGFNKMAKKLKLEEIKDSRVLLSVPEIFKVDDSSVLSTKEKNEFYKNLDKALSSCCDMRAKEGSALKKEILTHLSDLQKQIDQVKKKREVILKGLKEKYQQRLEKLGFPGELDEQRLAQEIIIAMDRSDITEEIHRLEIHLKAIKELMNQKESIGKKMDFFAQELLREVNTMGSKSPSAELTQIVVDAKAIVEKYREQVQNIE